MYFYNPADIFADTCKWSEIAPEQLRSTGQFTVFSFFCYVNL